MAGGEKESTARPVSTDEFCPHCGKLFEDKLNGSFLIEARRAQRDPTIDIVTVYATASPASPASPGLPSHCP